MMRWIKRMFGTNFSRLKREEVILRDLVTVARHEERTAQLELRRELQKSTKPSDYKPSILAQGFGWRGDEPD